MSLPSSIESLVSESLAWTLEFVAISVSREAAAALESLRSTAGGIYWLAMRTVYKSPSLMLLTRKELVRHSCVGKTHGLEVCRTK
jgi:hypothetical protein